MGDEEEEEEKGVHARRVPYLAEPDSAGGGKFEFEFPVRFEMAPGMPTGMVLGVPPIVMILKDGLSVDLRRTIHIRCRLLHVSGDVFGARD